MQFSFNLSALGYSIKNSFLWCSQSDPNRNLDACSEADLSRGMSSFPRVRVFSEGGGTHLNLLCPYLFLSLPFSFSLSFSLSLVFSLNTLLILRNLCIAFPSVQRRGASMSMGKSHGWIARSLICWRRYYQFRWGRAARPFGKTAFDLVHPVGT